MKPDPLNLRKKLRSVGVTQGPQSFPADVIQARKLKLQSADKLIDMQFDYAFYTPALLYIRVPGIPEVLPNFIAEYGQDITNFAVEFDKPVFHGLTHLSGDPRWNYVLYAVEREHWLPFLSYMGMVAYNEPGFKMVWRVRPQIVEIPDPLQMKRIVISQNDIKWTTITAFGLDSNKGCHYLRRVGMQTKACFNRNMIFADTIAFTESLQLERPNPYKDTEDQDAYRIDIPN